MSSPSTSPADDRDLLARAAAWPNAGHSSELTQPALARLAADVGIDFATAVLYDRLRRSAEHGPFIRRLDDLVAHPPRFLAPIDALLAVVPGAYYRELPRAGGDGRILREQAAAYGLRTAVVPTRSTGTAAENGRILLDWLADRPDERIILASISKGAADIKASLALSGAAAAFRPVVAWLNLSGLPAGTAIANWLLDRPLTTLAYRAVFWWKGLDIGVIRPMARGPGTPLDFPLTLPAHIRLVNVAGFPLRRHLSTAALRRCHRRLAPWGPNDGMMLLADACSLPGLLYPVWGADHNLRPADGIGPQVAALAFYLAETLGLWAGRPAEVVTR
jgi:hypothetical protein